MAASSSGFLNHTLNFLIRGQSLMTSRACYHVRTLLHLEISQRAHFSSTSHHLCFH